MLMLANEPLENETWCADDWEQHSGTGKGACEDRAANKTTKVLPRAKIRAAPATSSTAPVPDGALASNAVRPEGQKQMQKQHNGWCSRPVLAPIGFGSIPLRVPGLADPAHVANPRNAASPALPVLEQGPPSQAASGSRIRAGKPSGGGSPRLDVPAPPSNPRKRKVAEVQEPAQPASSSKRSRTEAAPISQDGGVRKSGRLALEGEEGRARAREFTISNYKAKKMTVSAKATKTAKMGVKK
ncbi:uncharacterized protein B0H18DRAFT_1128992 [Fomitopsis serialis]|uniref:uncharacterized protein n=1 Tax=Fomitopsis serialis TaxID=139415 RepID=UPI0020072E1E|nr:uncharacterized protein B0H18DRAFT_1128992 [Neoantrodia serialis]KAH9911237.1 hypothetical protein B0H18DRAFT_1128992 [Neoantrodia serialis]